MPDQAAMPADGSASAAVHVLSARLAGGSPSDGGQLPGLAEFLAAVPDHRRAQGRRHALATVLALAAAAVAAGRSRWWRSPGGPRMRPRACWPASGCAATGAAGAGGAQRDHDPPCPGRHRRDRAGGAAGRLAASPCGRRRGCGRAGVGRGGRQDAARRHPARWPGGAPARGDDQRRAVIAQREAGHKTNEITQVKPLLDLVDLRGAVVTLDALHAQRDTARYLVEDKHADYLFTAVKDNQPRLFDALDALPWAQGPAHAFAPPTLPRSWPACASPSPPCAP